MGFHNDPFPDNISYGSRGGPGYRSSVIFTDSGKRHAVQRWSNALRRYNVAYGVKEYDDLTALLEFYLARDGIIHSFPFKDYLDHATTPTHRVGGTGDAAVTFSDVTIGTGDGSTTTFQMFKTYTSGVYSKNRAITKTKTGTVLAAVDGVEKDEGVDFSVNDLTGILTFTTPPPDGDAVTAGCEFFVPCFFGDEVDELFDISVDSFEAGAIDQIPLIEDPDDGLQTPEDLPMGGSKRIDPMATSVSLSRAEALLYALNPTSSGLTVRLPDPTYYQEGAPIFAIANLNGTNSLTVRDHDNNLVGTIAASGFMEILLTVDAVGDKLYLGR